MNNTYYYKGMINPIVQNHKYNCNIVELYLTISNSYFYLNKIIVIYIYNEYISLF